MEVALRLRLATVGSLSESRFLFLGSSASDSESDDRMKDRAALCLAFWLAGVLEFSPATSSWCIIAMLGSRNEGGDSVGPTT
ncbi:hypothetical protein PRIC1_004860 [Phytophthora ramorum]|uniref:uncharacterized protein n=1 Tax=Phytophthora ramorum TaxID=164328 RepID=UPI0030A80F76|nr:hypothetical protein KRP23_4616 [Phytophthora ramorum]